MSDRRRALRRLEIPREAIRLFRDQGVDRTSGEQIVEAAGLSAGATDAARRDTD